MAMTPMATSGQQPQRTQKKKIRGSFIDNANQSDRKDDEKITSKPKAMPLRHRRTRERRNDDEDDELEQKFSKLGGFSSSQRPPRPKKSATQQQTSATGRLSMRPQRQPVCRLQQPQTQAQQPQQRRESIERNTRRLPAARRQRIGTKGFSKAASAPPAAAASVSKTLSFTRTSPAHPQQPQDPPLQRKRSDSAGSDSDYSSSDDEVYPEERSSTTSAFPVRLTLFMPQKRIPKRVSRDAVIDTIFAALFTRKPSDDDIIRSQAYGFGDDTGTDTDEPNEEFVKRGLAASLFKDGLGTSITIERRGAETQEQAVDRFITPNFIHTLVTDMRFEDFRTASARIDIVRAIHKNCPSKRLHIARALADAACLRLQYVAALTHKAQALEIERNQAITDNKNDHGHGFTELLRYAIEHVGESMHGFDTTTANEEETHEILRNYAATLLFLWRAHWLDPAGSDEEELISCAGQFVAYMPTMALDLLQRLLSQWPTKYPSMEVIGIRMLARVIMTSPPLPQLDPNTTVPLKIFSRLAKCIQSPHVQVAQEALAFTGCQFVLMHFVGVYDEIYAMLSDALHANTTSHWNETIRTTSERNFDRALDFAS